MSETQRTRRTSVDSLRRICRTSGIPVTVQRQRVLEVLSGHTDHPTAETVFSEVEKSLPGISRATVYRSLNTLVRLGLASVVCHPGAAARFDPRTTRHHHMLCVVCLGIQDLDASELDGLSIPDPTRTGFHASEYSVHFRGVCGACAQKSEKSVDAAPGARAKGSVEPGKAVGPLKKRNESLEGGSS